MSYEVGGYGRYLFYCSCVLLNISDVCFAALARVQTLKKHDYFNLKVSNETE